MSTFKKKHYKKRKPAAHIQPKKVEVKQPVQEVSKREEFLDNWLWLITLIAIILITVLLVILFPKLDSCEACNNCGKKADENALTVDDNIDLDDVSFTDTVTSPTDEIISAADEVVTEATTEATTTTTTTTTAAPTTTTTPAPAGKIPDLTGFNVNDYTDQFKMPANGEEVAVFDTNMGIIKMRLFDKAAPKTVENFKTHIKDGYYNGVIFHRVIKGFMIQGGDPQGNGTGGESIWGGTFEDEFCNGYYNFYGSVAMANTGVEGTNGSQFFINQNDNVKGDFEYGAYDVYNKYFPEWVTKAYYQYGGYPVGDHEMYEQTHYNGHTVFGQVFEGMDVVNAIASVEVGENDKPVKDVVINKAYLEKYNG